MSIRPFFRRLRLPDGAPAAVMVDEKTLLRLSGTCFRGPGCRRAGNFSRWNNCGELFRDEVFLELFQTAALQAVEAGEDGDRARNFTVEYPEAVGWDSTDNMDHYPLEVLEDFRPNARSSAVRVRAEFPNIPAPRTRLVTVIHALSFDQRHGWMLKLWSLYPGHYVGELKGDITTRTQRIFFDWNHPGA